MSQIVAVMHGHGGVGSDEADALLLGPNGVGKGMRCLVPNLLSIEGKSIMVLDCKAQLAAMTAKHRHQNGNDVKIIDPRQGLSRLSPRLRRDVAEPF